MAKIKITEKQAQFLGLDNQKNKKNVLKITKEQYDRIFASGLINESTNNDLTRVDKTFKKEFAGKDIKNLEGITEDQMGGDFDVRKPNPSISKNNQTKFGAPITEAPDNFKNEMFEFLKFLYRKSENLSPYWEQKGLTFDEICETLLSKKIIISKNGKYELSKALGDPKQAMQTLETELKSLVGEETPELETEEQSVGGYPSGAQEDPNAPYNQVEPTPSKTLKPKSEPLKVVLYNREMALLKADNGSFYVFNYDHINRNDFAEFAEYPDFEIDNHIIQSYVNYNLDRLTKGEGVDDWEIGKVDLVKIDSQLKQELISMYDKNKHISTVLNSIEENSGGFDKAIEPTKKAFVKSSNDKPSQSNILDKLKALKQREIDRRGREASKQTGEIDETTTAASSGAFTAPMGVVTKEMPVDADKLKVPIVYETTTTQTAGDYTYDANALPGITRDGSFKKPKQTKAQKDTQWAGGSFVELNDCTKLNNKSAGSGCSQGAVDNVVKLKKSSGNINAPSLSKGKQ